MSWGCKSSGGILSFTSPPLLSLSTAGDGGTGGVWEQLWHPLHGFPFSQAVCQPREFRAGAGCCVAAAPCAGEIKHPLSGDSLALLRGH